MTLDRIDFGILTALQNNARLSNKELAAKVGLAPSSCLQRVRHLMRSGVLQGHHADVSGAALGIGVEALVAIRLVRHSRDVFRRLNGYLRSMPEVLCIYHVSGVNDLQVHVAVRDIQHLRDLVVERFAIRAEVDHCETAVIYELHLTHQRPCYAQVDDVPARPVRAPHTARGATRKPKPGR
jgi:DNA-binding Lrp family transcriptional regulator